VGDIWGTKAILGAVEVTSSIGALHYKSERWLLIFSTWIFLQQTHYRNVWIIAVLIYIVFFTKIINAHHNIECEFRRDLVYFISIFLLSELYTCYCRSCCILYYILYIIFQINHNITYVFFTFFYKGIYGLLRITNMLLLKN